MKNLLPNASFEIDFGQAKHDWVKYNPGEGAADNWTDMFTPLTAPLAKNDQVPQTWPTIEAAAGASDLAGRGRQGRARIHALGLCTRRRCGGGGAFAYVRLASAAELGRAAGRTK